MKLKQRLIQIVRRPMVSYTVLAATYLLLILLLPASKDSLQAHSFSEFEYRVIRLSIGIIYLIAWFAAFYGYKKLMEYAALIKRTKEGAAFKQLAIGSAWLAWSLPVALIVTNVLYAISYCWEDFKPTAIILTNYLSLILPLVGFTVIGSAAHRLTQGAQLRPSLLGIRAIAVLLALIGVAYCYATFTRFDLQNLGDTNNPYYLPILAMITTIMVPYLYAWFAGLFAIYEISLVGRQASGLLYRNALMLLVIGFGVVIVSSIALEYLFSLQPRQGYFTLDYRLVLSLLFRVLAGIGFALIALGAIRLKRIEEI